MIDSFPILTERVFFRSPAAHIVLKCNIVGHFSKDKFEATIVELQRIHPILTCTIQEETDGTLCFQIQNDKKIPISYKDSIQDDDWRNTVLEQLAIPFILEDEIALRIFVITKQDSFDLIIVTHHVLGDALSFAYLLSDFSKIYFYDAVLPVRLTKPISSSDQLPASSNLNILTRMIFNKVNKNWKNEHVTFKKETFPQLFSNFYDKNCSDFITLTLRGDTYKRLKQLAKDNRITVHTLLSTAFLRQYQLDISTSPNKKKMIIAVNIRKRLKFDPGTAIGNYASGINVYFDYDFNKDFWSNAHKIHKSIKKELISPQKVCRLSQVFCHLDGSFFDGIFYHHHTDFKNKYIPKASRLLHMNHREDGFDLSNLGQIPLKCKDTMYNINSVVYLPPATINCDLTFGVVTAGDEMNISILYVKSLYDETFMHEFGDKLIDFINKSI